MIYQMQSCKWWLSTDMLLIKFLQLYKKVICCVLSFIFLTSYLGSLSRYKHLNRKNNYKTLSRNITSTKRVNSGNATKIKPDKFSDINLPEGVKEVFRDNVKKTAVVYMVQGPAINYSTWNERIQALGSSAILVYHSYDKPCSLCLYNRKTNHATGRNLLLRHVLEKLQHISKTFKYFTFADYDIGMYCEASSSIACWQSWHMKLLHPQVNFAEVSPKTWLEPFNEKPLMQECVDNSMVTVHHKALFVVMPLAEYQSSLGSWYNTHVHWMILHRCLPLSVYSDNTYHLDNLAISKDANYGKEVFNASIVYSILSHELPWLRPWRQFSILWHHCELKKELQFSWKLNRVCVKPLLNRFVKWYWSNKPWWTRTLLFDLHMLLFVFRY